MIVNNLANKRCTAEIDLPKEDLIKSLKKDAKQAKKVYIATDPDREGEAIAWHLAKILEDETPKITRVTFNEITKGAVQKAIKEPRDIEEKLGIPVFGVVPKY